MKKFVHQYLPVFLFCICVVSAQCGFALKHELHTDSLNKTKTGDTAVTKLADTIVPRVVNKIETYNFTLSRSSNYFKRRMDTTKISQALPTLEKSLAFFKTRLDKSDQTMNLRNLNTFTIMLQESATRLSEWQTNLNDYSDQVVKNNQEVKKIINDATLKTDLPDTALNKQVRTLLRKAQSIDSLQQIVITRINVMKNKVSISSLLASDMLSDLNYRMMQFKSAMWGHEDAPLYAAKPSNYKQSLLDVIISTFTKSLKVFNIYTGLSWNIRSLNLIIFAIWLSWCFINYRRVKKYEDADKILQPLHFLNHSVIISCLGAFLCVGPFLYSNPPMVYVHINEFIRLLCITYLLLPFFTSKAKTNWIIMSVLWFIFAFDDLFLEASFGERYWLLFGSIAVVLVCLKMLRDKKNIFVNLEEYTYKHSIIIFTLSFSVISIIFNITGRVTLAKMFSTTAVQGFLFAFMLKVFSTLILEALYLQSEALRESKYSAFLNYKELKIKLKRVLGIIAVILWLIAFCRSMSMYDIVIRMLDMFFNKQRSIGNMQFSFISIAIFVFVIWIASIISQFLNFFFGSKLNSNTNKRSNIGSIMLLVRLAIWALGFLIAIAAAGIPLDKISIMIGALGVGIGFGLQNIVNNLVSGIILAFERPIQVGDFIEVDGRAGTVKEIGVRSSKISNADGADIIVPNGDMLSKHLINWTLHNRNKRVEIVVGIAYEADVRKAKSIIETMLKNNEKVMQTPPPLVLFNNFGDSSVDFKVLFWTFDLADAGTLRSNMMIEIFESFAKAGIEIPYPKSEVYIKKSEL